MKKKIWAALKLKITIEALKGDMTIRGLALGGSLQFLLILIGS